MPFNKQDRKRDACMLDGKFAKKGYDWWWHSFTAEDAETGEEKPFFVEYFLCNPEKGGSEPILGQNPENKANGRRPSYLLVKAGCWGEPHLQLHRFIAWDQVKITQPRGEDGYEVRAEDCFASETVLKGSVFVSSEQAALPEYMCDAGEMTWDLKVEKQVAFNVGYGAGSLFRALKAFEMYWHAEGMKSFYSGEIILNGRKYTVRPETSYGYADKNWGAGFTSPWVWLSSNHMKSRLSGKWLENSVFDIGGGRPKVFWWALERQLLSAFWYEGEEYEYNFSKFWTGVKTEFSESETEDEVRWYVRQENRRTVMETEVTCLKKDMLLVNYEEPDGRKRHNKLWNGGNGTGRVRLYRKTKAGKDLIDDLDVYNIGCEYGEFDE